MFKKYLCTCAKVAATEVEYRTFGVLYPPPRAVPSSSMAHNAGSHNFASIFWVYLQVEERTLSMPGANAEQPTTRIDVTNAVNFIFAMIPLIIRDDGIHGVEMAKDIRY